MTSNTGFEGFSDAPAPMALGDLESAGSVAEAAPAPMGIDGLGAVTGDAPAPAPLDPGEQTGAVGEMAPVPVDIGETAAGAEVEVEGEAPTPHGGPGDVDATTIQAEAVAETAPTPMELSELEAMEAG